MRDSFRKEHTFNIWWTSYTDSDCSELVDNSWTDRPHIIVKLIGSNQWVVAQNRKLLEQVLSGYQQREFSVIKRLVVLSSRFGILILKDLSYLYVGVFETHGTLSKVSSKGLNDVALAMWSELLWLYTQKGYFSSEVNLRVVHWAIFKFIL